MGPDDKFLVWLAGEVKTPPPATPKNVIDACKGRLRAYRSARSG